mmetsp:Transcript_19523/g.27236  ORF Transcript_19523/g.27236 Transcript_19523/m.27236 type:complete len:686 (-) Transcript_19523:22-2079(-)
MQSPPTAPIRTVGFQTEAEQSSSAPISIPSKATNPVPVSASAEKSLKFLSSSFDNERDFKAYKSQLTGWSDSAENISPSSSLPVSANLAIPTGKSPKRNSPQKLHSDTDILSSSPGNPNDPLRRRYSSSLNANNGVPNVTSFNNSIVVEPPKTTTSNAPQPSTQTAQAKPNDKQKLSKAERKAMYEKTAQQAQQKRKETGHQPHQPHPQQQTPPNADQPQQQPKQKQESQPKQQQEKQPKQQQEKQPKQQQEKPKQQQEKSKQQQEKPSKQEKPQQDNKSQPQNIPTKQASASGKLTTTPPATPAVEAKKKAKADKKKIVVLQPADKQVPLFSHLPQHSLVSSVNLNIGFGAVGVLHPVIVELGLKYAKGVIIGSTARCVAMLEAFKQVITDFESPSGLFFKDFDIKPYVQFLVDCRPISISMGNAINYLKVAIGETKKFSEEQEAKEYVLEKIDKFFQDRITVADEIIATTASGRINDGDVILTYARSHVVEQVLKKAFDQGKKFRVIVVDSLPRKEGKVLLNRLVQHGIKCTYVFIHAVSYMMKEVSKVFVGAYAMMANGNLLSRSGTALVAMMASSYHVPFIVCCETCKFTDRVQLESISFNELGNPEEILAENTEADGTPNQLLKEWKDIPNLKLLNLMYDLTPSQFISAVVTEVGMTPPTSVPVVLRIFSQSWEDAKETL